MPEWVQLNRSQLMPAGADQSSTTKVEDEKPLVEFRQSKTGDRIELRTQARIDRKRGGLLGIGHALWRNLKLGLGIDSKNTQREQAEHRFDKSVNTLVEDLAQGIVTKRDFIDKLDEIRSAAATLTETSPDSSGQDASQKYFADRFGKNLSLCLLAIGNQNPLMCLRVIDTLKLRSDDMKMEDYTSKFIQNAAFETTIDTKEMRADRNTAFKTYTDTIDSVLAETTSIMVQALGPRPAAQPANPSAQGLPQDAQDPGLPKAADRSR